MVQLGSQPACPTSTFAPVKRRVLSPEGETEQFIHSLFKPSTMLQFEIKKAEMKIGKHKGTTMYFAHQTTHHCLTTTALEYRIERMTSLTRADVRATIIALSAIVQEELSQGRSVDLGELGTFKIAATGKRMLTAKEVTPETIRRPHVRFYAKRPMRLAARSVALEIVHPEKSSSAKPKKPKGGGSQGGSEGGGHVGA